MQCHKAAKRVTHKNGSIELKSGDSALKVRDVICDLVGGRTRPGTLSMPAEIEGKHTVRPCQRWGNMVPPMGVGRAAVKQDERRIRRLAPFQIMQGKAVHADETTRGSVTHGH